MKKLIVIAASSFLLLSGCTQAITSSKTKPEYQSQIDDLKTTVEELQSKVEDQNLKISDLESKNEDLESQVEDLQKQSEIANDLIDDNTSKIGDIKVYLQMQ